ncbi:hypothetical protein BGZ91_005099, partial [Linnemannia elongata]
CSELVWQLRGWCGERQVPNCKYALQHNVGLGGAVVISLYKKANELGSSPKYVDSRKRVGYNPATEAREVSEEEVESVRAKGASSEFMARL